MHTPGKLDPRALALGGAIALALATSACDGGSKTPALSRSDYIVREAPQPPENGPQLGVVAEVIQVREYTDARAPSPSDQSRPRTAASAVLARRPSAPSREDTPRE